MNGSVKNGQECTAISVEYPMDAIIIVIGFFALLSSTQ